VEEVGVGFVLKEDDIIDPDFDDGAVGEREVVLCAFRLLIELEKAILASECPGREFVRNKEDVARSGGRVDLFSEADGA
jgi:hypothetical protein